MKGHMIGRVGPTFSPIINDALRRVFTFLSVTFLSFYSSVAAPPVVDCQFEKASFIFDLEWSACSANVPVTIITYDELASYLLPELLLCSVVSLKLLITQPGHSIEKN
jgi:hypothetical protein